MRDRHLPRLCRSCEAPMARQEDTCWSCGAPWDYQLATRSALRVIPGEGDSLGATAPSPVGKRTATGS